MSRKKTEINPIRIDRVKLIMRRENISQKDLAERTFQTQQNISRIMQKKQALTEENAKLINKAFPQYRLAWILGIDDDVIKCDKCRYFSRWELDKKRGTCEAWISSTDCDGYCYLAEGK